MNSKWIEFIKKPAIVAKIKPQVVNVINKFFNEHIVASHTFVDLVMSELEFGIAPNLELLYEDNQATSLLNRILYHELPQVFMQWKQHTKDNKFELGNIATSSGETTQGYGGLSIDNQDGDFRTNKANATSKESSNLEIFMKMKDIETRIFRPIFARIERELVIRIWAV